MEVEVVVELVEVDEAAVEVLVPSEVEVLVEVAVVEVFSVALQPIKTRGTKIRRLKNLAIIFYSESSG